MPTLSALDPHYCHVALPLGIGDAHWSCMKLRALAEHVGKPIFAHINESADHHTVGYLRLMPFIERAECSKLAPTDIGGQMSPSYYDDCWGTLAGCHGWGGLDYILVANGWLERGKHIRDWLPELDTEMSPEVVFDNETLERSYAIAPESPVLLYPSGVGPNSGFHGGWWQHSWWVDIAGALNEAGVVPTFVGAPTKGDMGYWGQIQPLLDKLGTPYHNLVGKTSLPDYIRLIQRARCWCGLNSGGGIVSASFGTPTVMLWADRRWPVGAVNFRPGFQHSWLPDQTPHYAPMSYGDPATTPESVAEAILRLAR